MADKDKLEIIIEYEGGAYVKGQRIRENWVRRPFEVHTKGGTTVELENYRMALARAALHEVYGEVNVSTDDALPISVALDGSPAIATYLHGAQERPRSEVAEVMGVTEKTVLKYLNRFDPRRTDS